MFIIGSSGSLRGLDPWGGNELMDQARFSQPSESEPRAAPSSTPALIRTPASSSKAFPCRTLPLRENARAPDLCPREERQQSGLQSPAPAPPWGCSTLVYTHLWGCRSRQYGAYGSCRRYEMAGAGGTLNSAHPPSSA